MAPEFVDVWFELVDTEDWFEEDDGVFAACFEVAEPMIASTMNARNHTLFSCTKVVMLSP